VLVKNNTVIGGGLIPNSVGFVATGIYIAGFTEDVQVIDNTVSRVAHSGIRLENTTRNRVSGNKLISTGTGGIVAFEVTDTTDSEILDNVITIDPNSPLGTEIIQEAGKSARNTYQRNLGSKGMLLHNRVGSTP
jgi:parallel beta-helix repeat protein